MAGISEVIKQQFFLHRMIVTGRHAGESCEVIHSEQFAIQISNRNTPLLSLFYERYQKINGR